MTEKIIVVQGAVCKCSFGSAPDTLNVLTHQKEYANDQNGVRKLIVTTKELGATFQNNSFGACLASGKPPPPCTVMVTGWENYYEDVELSNGGNIIVHDSKAICAVTGTACIEILHHGQVGVPCARNFENADGDLHDILNPMANVRDMLKPERTHDGITSK